MNTHGSPKAEAWNIFWCTSLDMGLGLDFGNPLALFVASFWLNSNIFRFNLDSFGFPFLTFLVPICFFHILSCTSVILGSILATLWILSGTLAAKSLAECLLHSDCPGWKRVYCRRQLKSAPGRRVPQGVFSFPAMAGQTCTAPPYPAVRHHHGDVALPLLPEELGHVKVVELRDEVEELPAPVLPLRLEKVRKGCAPRALRAEPPLDPHDGHDVWVGLRHDEVVDVEELGQTLHGKVVLEAAVAPPPRAQLSLRLPRDKRAVA